MRPRVGIRVRAIDTKNPPYLRQGGSGRMSRASLSSRRPCWLVCRASGLRRHCSGRRPFRARQVARHPPGSCWTCQRLHPDYVFFGTGLLAQTLVDADVVHGTDCPGRGGLRASGQVLARLINVRAYWVHLPRVGSLALVVPVLHGAATAGIARAIVASALSANNFMSVSQSGIVLLEPRGRARFRERRSIGSLLEDWTSASSRHAWLPARRRECSDRHQ